MTMTIAARMVVAVAAVLGASSVHGLHQDQAGLNDWTVRNLGGYAAADFVDDDVAVVATKMATVGGLRVSNGALAWRQVLPDDRNGMLASAAKQGFFATASADACTVEMWSGEAESSALADASDAKGPGLLWGAQLCEGDAAAAASNAALDLLDNDFNNDGTPDVAVLTTKKFFLLDGSSGRTLHEVEHATGVTWQGVVEVADSAAGKKRKRPALFVYGVDASSGALQVRKLAASGATLDPVSGLEGADAQSTVAANGAVARVGSALVFATKDSGALAAFDCAANSLKQGGGATAIEGAVQSLGSPSFFGTSAGLVYAVDGDLKATQALKGAKVIAAGVSGDAVVAAVQSAGDDGQCGPISRVVVQTSGTTVDLADGFPEELGQSGARGRVEKIFARATSTGLRAIFVFEDESAVGVEVSADGSSAKTLFVREEALAGVTEAVAVDLPPTDEVGSLGDEAAQVFAHGSHARILAFRLKDQVRTVQRFFQSLVGSATRHLRELVASKGQIIVQAYRGELPRAESLSQGEMFSFGFRRVLVVRTASGKVFGLNSADGSLLWGARSPGSRLFVTRAREAGLDHPAEVAIVDEAEGRVTWRNAITGAVTRVESAEVPLAQVAALPGDGFAAAETGEEEDVSPAAVLVAIDQSQRVHVFPSARADAVLKMEDRMRALHFVVYANETRSLTGYTVDPSQRVGVELWTFAVPASQTLLTVQGQSEGALRNPGIKRGDGAVLVRFIDPHLLLVATQSGQHLQVTIMDGVSGRIVARFTHKKSTGPVHAVLADNMVTYSFWNKAMNRQEISAVGLYEGEIGPRDLNIWSSRPSMGSGNAFSSYDASVAPDVMQKTFYLERAVAALGVTTTRFGIADRRVLVGTVSGAVNMQLTQVLDPRRPIGKLSNEEKEEGLMLYSSELPLIPTQTVTYYESIARLSLIKTFATRLESTTLVFAAGIDVFFTRVMPSRGFDVLDEDFASGLLLALIAGLLALTIYLSRAVGKSMLAEAWK